MPLIPDVHAPSDLFDKQGCKTLSTKFFVHAQEVDLCHLNMLAVDHHVYRDGSDAGVEYFIGLAPYSNNPVWVVPWCVQGPSQEVNRIVETELSIGILNVVFR